MANTNDHLSPSFHSRVFGDAVVMTGVFVGVALVIAFTIWLFIANRMPSLERFALLRNLIGAAVLSCLALIPVARFVRSPRRILISSLIAWSILTLSYSALAIYFGALEEHYSAWEIFILGCVSYLLMATLSWLGTCIWRARASHSS